MQNAEIMRNMDGAPIWMEMWKMRMRGERVGMREDSDGGGGGWRGGRRG